MWARFVRASEAKAQGLGGKFGDGGGVRPPPLHPEALAAKLARKVFTNGKSDLEMVAGIYARTLDGAFGGAEVLEFTGCGWGDEEVKALAKVLPLARSVTLLNLIENPKIGADGWGALAEAIAAGGAPRLTIIRPVLSGIKLVWPTSDDGALKRACEARGIGLDS